MSSSRTLSPLSARVGRGYRAIVVAAARRRGLTVSSMLKEALERYLDTVDLTVDPRIGSAPHGRIGSSRVETSGGFTETPIR